MSNAGHPLIKDNDRVLIFSGVFDPVHRGHLSIARRSLEKLGDTIVFMPERVPTHKHGRTSFKHRVAMLKLALKSDRRMRVMESPHGKHTVHETLSWLREQFPSGQNFGLLMGNDAAAYVMKWPGIQDIASYGVDILIVAARDDKEPPELSQIQIKGVKVVMLDASSIEISSTLIRDNFQANKSETVEVVAEYAQQNKLYLS